MSHIQARRSGRLAPIDVGVVEARFLARRDGNKTYSCQRHVAFPGLGISCKELLSIGNPLTSFLYRPLTIAILASACPVDDLMGLYAGCTYAGCNRSPVDSVQDDY